VSNHKLDKYLNEILKSNIMAKLTSGETGSWEGEKKTKSWGDLFSWIKGLFGKKKE